MLKKPSGTGGAAVEIECQLTRPESSPIAIRGEVTQAIVKGLAIMKLLSTLQYLL
jgi:hypothetical protein